MYMDSLTSLEFTAELLSWDTKYELDNDESEQNMFNDIEIEHPTLVA
jgi:hypothetical protein